ncbi:MAG: hypothetical protein MRJ65_10125 [Candidatus Brocadiaceae bacterium]|nr:hypothetical protein [Candidatus Brocadiaceae bacterium]
MNKQGLSMIHTGRFLSAAFLLLLAGLAGCTAMGPGTVARDRFDYTTAISDSWKNQMLLNMVKIRYGDAPVFLDVASVINQYQLTGVVNLGASWFHNPFSTSQSISTTGAYFERPTITYSPIIGEKFARSLMTPIPPTAILTLIQGGYPVDLVFRITVHSINGIRNRFGGSARLRGADPEFYPLLEKMRKVQSSGNFGMRLQKGEGEDTVLFVFREKKDELFDRDITDNRKLLGLRTDVNEFRVVYGAIPRDDEEIAILSRSVLEIIVDLASTVEVPELHVTEKRVNPTFIEISAQGDQITPLVRIQSSREKPPDAFVSIPFRDHWFWIDDKDLSSKRLFSFLMFVFTLVEKEEKAAAPIITIPTGG